MKIESMATDATENGCVQMLAAVTCDCGARIVAQRVLSPGQAEATVSGNLCTGCGKSFSFMMTDESL